MEKNKTSYLIKDIEKATWKKFRGQALLNGFDNAGHWLRHLIEHMVIDEK